MLSFFSELNNRELAIAVWLGAFIISVLFIKTVRKSVISLLKILFSFKIQLVVLSLCLYVTFIVWLLYFLHFWNFSLLKDTLFWFFGVGFISIFKTTGKVEIRFFKSIVRESWKWTIIIEFISNLYVFSLPIELVLTLVIIFLSMMQPVAERDAKYKDVNSCITKSLSILGISLILYALFKTIQNYKEFFSWENTKSILLSPVLTVFYIPFLYVLTVVFQYEVLFIMLKSMSRQDKSFHKLLKREVIKTAKFNLSKINNISSQIMKADLYKVKNIPGYLKAISKKIKSKP